VFPKIACSLNDAAKQANVSENMLILQQQPTVVTGNAIAFWVKFAGLK